MKEHLGELNRLLDRFLTPAVKTILVINTLVCFLFVILSVSPAVQMTLVSWLGQTPYDSVFRLRVWEFLTYAFVHVEFTHLFFNMLALWFFAPPLENRWGTRPFWRFYLITAVGAGIFQSIFTLLLHFGSPRDTVIGASGAVFGVMLAYAAYYPDQPIYLWGVLPVKAKYLVGISIFMNFMMAAQQSIAGESRISYLTHLTGLGVAYVWIALHNREWDIRRWRYTRGF